MVKWNKGIDEQVDSSSNYINNMENEMNSICQMLSEETKKFDAKIFFDKIYGYIVKNDRLLYTNITNYIFTLNDEQFGTLQTNIDNVVSYVYSEQFKIDYPEKSAKTEREKERQKKLRTQRTILKMWDHVNLARRQYVLFHNKDEGFSQIVDEKMKNASTEIYKEMNGQLISLVGIFTALSFLVFGGVSSLDNIFAGAKDIPILKLIIIGCIWSFCIMNLVFTFMLFVARLTKLSVKSTDDVNANIVQKYPLVCWSNFVILFILVLSIWLYYIRKYGYTKMLDRFTQIHASAVSVVGILVIFGAGYFAANRIYKYWKQEKK